MTLTATIGHITTDIRNITLERMLIFLLGLSIFLSSSGIYIISALLTLYFLARLTSDREYRLFFATNKTAIFSLALYFLGLAVTIAYPGHLADISWYARKAAGLLIFPPLLYAFQSARTRRWGMGSLFIGFWLALLYTLQQAGWQWDGGRVAGPWLIDIWSVLLALFAALMVPLVFQQGLGKWRYLYIITAVAATLLLLMSGGRGPWLGFSLAVVLYLLCQQRRWLLYLLLLLALLAIPLHFWKSPPPFDWTIKRAESITDLDSKGNWIRLTLWQLSWCYNLDSARHRPWQFLVGGGPLHHESLLTTFHLESDCLSAATKKRLQPHPTNDTHNMYLDSLAKMGALWTPLIMLFIAAFICWRPLVDKREPASPGRWSARNVAVVFLVTGVFYSIMLHWTTFMLFFFLALGTGAAEGGNDKPTTEPTA
ncbi:MAG: O-antigen ligase family protein [Desulfurivibrio sp.]|nr:O-antigen ligase family protein [Desulfurivibrio sp.]